jgi:cytoskeletal protein CcmA (bactofilin family)
MVESQDSGTVIGADTVIKGEMTAENRARILGRFEGTIKAKGQVEVADKATCQADVEAKIVQIDGGMQGNITALEKIQLNASARMKGDVVATKLVVSDGACVDGHFKVGPDAVKKGAGQPAPTPQPGAGGPSQMGGKDNVGAPKK